MKKLFFLTALLCASVMAFATDEDTWLEGNSTYANQFKWFSIDGVTAPMEVVNIQSKNGFDVIFVNVGQADFDRESGIVGCEAITDQGAGVWIKISSLTKKNNTIYFKNSQEATLRGLVIYNDKGETSGDEKTNPQLTIDPTTVTLSAAAPAQTIQIQVTKADGSGAVSYESSNAGIASVSETGLVTAVGRGTATITVRVAEYGNYAAASKKLTVTVTGPINWDAFSWIGDGAGGGAYNNKYKLAAADSQNVINIQQPAWASAAGIYTEFPAGISSCNLGEGNYKIQGAGIILYLSAFTLQETEVKVTVASVEHTFSVYYADGSNTTTAITNTEVEAKAVKVFENGQLIIIKNGVKYNALGAELR